MRRGTIGSCWIGMLSLALAVGEMASPVLAQQSSNEVEKENVSSARSGNRSQVVAATQDESYVIGEEDVLNISVWKEPEITQTVPVRPDGKISLPLVHDIQAAGLTPSQLAMVIAEKLKTYLTEPAVTVIVTQINSRRIYILGEVNRAGVFPLLPNMTVLQAVSSAGGFTQFANLKGIFVLRNENGNPLKHPFNYKEVIKGNGAEQNIVLKPGDTIVVP